MPETQEERAKRLSVLLNDLIDNRVCNSHQVAEACNVSNESVKNLLKLKVTPTDANLNSYEKYIRSLQEDYPRRMRSVFMARVVKDEEFARFKQADLNIYSLEKYDNDFLATWRNSFRLGCIGLFRGGDELAGGIGMWPLSERQAVSLVKGEIKDEAEVEILSEAATKSEPSSHWYLGGAFLTLEHRKFGRALDLIRECLLCWSAECSDLTSTPFEVVSIPINDTSHNFLDWTGFATNGKLLGKHLLYRQHFPSLEDFRIWANTIPTQVRENYVRPSTRRPGGTRER